MMIKIYTQLIKYLKRKFPNGFPEVIPDLSQLKNVDMVATGHTHENDGKVYLTNPPKLRCKKCLEWYKVEEQVNNISKEFL